MTKDKSTHGTLAEKIDDFRGYLGMEKSTKSMADYLERTKLNGYFESASGEERMRLRGRLENILTTKSAKYDQHLEGLARRVTSKASMYGAVANDVYAFVSNAPLANISGLGYALFAAKSIAELPALAKYAWKSHDWYGAGVHLALKPVRYLIPIVGPLIEAGAFNRMVRRRIQNEAVGEFIKEFGDYKPLEERVSYALKVPIANVSEPYRAAA